MKILALDIESAPNVAHVWGLWQQNIGLPQILDSGYVLCWAAKWLGEDTIHFDSVYDSGPKRMLKRIHKLLEEADAVVHWNGSKFDIPTLNKEFIEHGMLPPSPYREIDLLKTSRKRFRFPSNKLDYVAQALGLGKKIQHRGHELWIACMNRDPDAWNEMREYNIQDVILLERIYERFQPWLTSPISFNLYRDDATEPSEHSCPTCGGACAPRGFTYTRLSKYQRYRCSVCGAWSRGRKAVGTGPQLTHCG